MNPLVKNDEVKFTYSKAGMVVYDIDARMILEE
jgi:hypothetical protein